MTAPAEQVIPLPGRLTFEQGAAVPVNYLTATAGLIVMAGLKAGERVLIHSAGGGMGISATQVAKRVGAEIFGTASAAKHDAIRAQGVDHPIDYRTQDFAEEVRRITGGEGIDVAFDALGPKSFRKDYRLLREGGRLVMYGYAESESAGGRNLAAFAGTLARAPFATFPWWKSLAVMNENKGVFGLNMLSWWKREGLARVLKPLSADLEAGHYDPVVAESFPFERAADAHRFIAERRNVGKVVLTP